VHWSNPHACMHGRGRHGPWLPALQKAAAISQLGGIVPTTYSLILFLSVIFDVRVTSLSRFVENTSNVCIFK